MANGDFFDTFLRNASNYHGGDPEYYEDTHDANGNYTGGPRGASASGGGFAPPPQTAFSQPMQPVYPPPQNNGYTPPPSGYSAAQRTEQNLSNPTQFVHVKRPADMPQQAMPLPTVDQYISPQLNQNFVIYRPRTTADVEQLIAYLRRREPALVDLDPMADSPDAQRLMDFTSGAAYALGDRVMTIRRNLFLITPDTIDVLKPENDKQ